MAAPRKKKKIRTSPVKKAPAKKPPKPPSARAMSPVAKEFRALLKTAAAKYPEVEGTKLFADSSIHTTPRAYGVAGISKDGPEIHVAPELADQPPSVIRGILEHELGHVAVLLGLVQAKRGYDAAERQADRVAEGMFGHKIFYNKHDVQCAGRGAQGRRPRPRGLR
jgi:hypothetical protein